MKEEVIVTSASLEEAKQVACKKLNANSIDDLEFEVIQMPEKKKFGIFGGSDAKIKAYLKKTQFDYIYDYLTMILEGFCDANCSCFEVKYNVEDNIVKFDISGENINLIIGHRGEVLNSIQKLLNVFAKNKFNGTDFKYKIFVNAGDYRIKREESLKNLANKMAKKVLKQNRNVVLDHMNAYERSIIHNQIQNTDGVKSWSEGEGFKRHIIIGIDRSFNKNNSLNESENKLK